MPKSRPQPSFGLHKLRELQLKLDSEKSLSKVGEFYMDKFADRPEFLEVGGSVDHPFLKEIIPIISQKLFNKDPHDIFLVKIPDHDFIHGSFWVENNIGGVIYFEKNLKEWLRYQTPTHQEMSTILALPDIPEIITELSSSIFSNDEPILIAHLPPWAKVDKHLGFATTLNTLTILPPSPFLGEERGWNGE
ncbi:hypothetical protein [[Phormidium] sp. ETS-05]|uniref:hypothetical protein n=1 Tax=[Phormidium] sp. ETS-05 TaxID=222819 RepID=UPI0018EF0B5F|nr:hypothetical protein [[Phormidium] sp. ETS-05]